ncbi:hypothetical protein BVI434_3560010 [Burkholderia vietnamiensis]|nr:hypothetical protein BVI434_3560010 [Burkholderia vietnamiensis]
MGSRACRDAWWSAVGGGLGAAWVEACGGAGGGRENWAEGSGRPGSVRVFLMTEGRDLPSR